MSINVNKITSTLARMSDQQLQQYAQMQKDRDPYALLLAVGEANRRKEMRAAGQSAQGMQEQPKVVDRMVAEMAPQPMPEDTGIARIPAEMNFAGGGIVAFADGGGVERYAPGGLIKAGPEFVRFLQNMGIDYMDFAGMDAAGKAPILDMFEQTKAAPSAATTPAATAAQAAQGTSRAFAAGQAARPVLDKAGSVIKGSAIPVIGGGLSAAQGLSEVDAAQAFYADPNVPTTEKVKQFARTGANVALPYVGGAVGSGMGPLGTVAGAGLGTGLAAMIENEGEALKQYRAKNEPSKAPSRADLRSQLNRADAATYAQPGAGAAPAGGTGIGSPGATGAGGAGGPGATKGTGTGAGTGAGTGVGKNPFSMESILEAQNKALGDSNYRVGELRNQLVEFRASSEKRAQDAIDRRNAEILAEGDVYKDRSDRLAERGKRLTTQKDQNTGLALLNAGLAIMSTPGSLATAIGKGAQVGTAQYASGLKDLRAAQERLDEANERIEELRLNRKDLNKRDIRALEQARDNALAEGEKLTFAFAKDIYGLNRADAKEAFSAYAQGQRTVYEQGEQTKRTLATINAGGDKTNLAAEKLVQDRVGEWEKANKLQLATMTPAQRAIELRNRTEQFRNDIYTQLKLTPTMGAGASSSTGFRMVN